MKTKLTKAYRGLLSAYSGRNPQPRYVFDANDFVVMVKHKADRSYVETMIRGWLRRAGLKLKEAKTRWIDMNNWSRGHQSKFNFLGFKFHLRCYKDNPLRFWIARQPSEEARKSLREALRERLHFGAVLKRSL